MGARRASVVVVLCASLAIGGTAGAVAQTAEGDAEQLCVSVAGPAPEGGWDVLSLSVAIAAGKATVTSVGAAADCGGAITVIEEPVVEEPLVDAPTAAPSPPAAAPLPVEVVDTAIVGSGDQAEYVAIFRNTNPSDWAANWMPVRMDLLDSDGELVTTYSNSLTLLPGQTDAIIGYASDAPGATQMEVVVANGETDWIALGDVPGDLTFSEVKTKATEYGPRTTGRISSTYEDQLESVRVDVIYRDPAGEMIGADYGYIDFIPAGGDASFKVESYSDEKLDIAETEVYYGGFLPPTE